MADKLMYVPNDDTQNYPFSRLLWVVETFGHSTKLNKLIVIQYKSPRLLSQRLRKRYYKTLGTSVINSKMSPYTGTKSFITTLSYS